MEYKTLVGISERVEGGVGMGTGLFIHPESKINKIMLKRKNLGIFHSKPITLSQFLKRIHHF